MGPLVLHEKAFVNRGYLGSRHTIHIYRAHMPRQRSSLPEHHIIQFIQSIQSPTSDLYPIPSRSGENETKNSWESLMNKALLLGDYERTMMVNNNPLINTYSSWWLNQPIRKICSSNWIIFPKVRDDFFSFNELPTPRYFLGGKRGISWGGTLRFLVEKSLKTPRHVIMFSLNSCRFIAP